MIKNTFYLFLVGVLAFSCKKEDPAPTTPVTPTPATEEYFLSGKIDGTTWYAENTKNGCQIFSGYSGNMGDPIVIDYESSFEQEGLVSPITSPLVGNLALKMSNYSHPYDEYMDADTHFNSTFATGSKSFYVQGNSTPGAEIVYYDQQGDFWSTKFGSQSGSTFSITSVTSGTLGFDKVKFVKGTFTGKIYSEDNPSQFKTVTNGSFYMIFQKA